MSTLAIVNPATLIGKELQERLGQRRDLWQDVKLLTTRDDEEGQLTELAGGAALVQGLESEALAEVDFAFLCGPRDSLDSAIAALPSTASAVLFAPEAREDDGPLVVAGVSTPEAGGLLVSPHPAVVGACHLLHPLSGFGPTTAVATVLQPASMHGEEGFEELFEQTRRMLEFSKDRPQAIFKRQLAFNVLPLERPLHGLGAQARQLLGGTTEIALHVLQGSVFHGTSISLFVRLAEDPGEAALREAFEASAFLRMEDDEPLLSPIDVVAEDQMVIGEISREPGTAGIYRLWAVLDNLTLGSALNGIQIADALFQPGMVS